jgi:hypothetical protein
MAATVSAAASGATTVRAPSLRPQSVECRCFRG